MRRLQPAARAVTGAISGVAATVAMDKVGTIFWERAMDAATQAQERRVEPKFPLTVLAERIAARLNLTPNEKWGGAISTAMHWGIGVVCGALHGLLEEPLRAERAGAQPVALGMPQSTNSASPRQGWRRGQKLFHGRRMRAPRSRT